MIYLTEGQIWKDLETETEFRITNTPYVPGDDPENDSIGVVTVEDGERYSFFRERFRNMSKVADAEEADEATA